jgi:hypothetical protein
MQGWLFLDQEFWGEEQIKALLTAVGQSSIWKSFTFRDQGKTPSFTFWPV